MKRLILMLAASALTAAPALAQHQGHQMPPTPAKQAPAKKAPAKKAPVKKAPVKKAPAKKAPAKKAAAKKPAAKKPAAKPAAKKAPAKAPPVDAHAGHTMPEPAPPADPRAGHAMPTADPHAGHAMPATDPHAGHGVGVATESIPKGPPPAAALEGPEHAADSAWGAAPMEPGRAVLFAEHGAMRTFKLLLDQFETRIRGGRDGYLVNGEAWVGGDIDKAWLKTEIEGAFGEKPEQAELQLLWSHAIDPWFDVQAGVRLDLEPAIRGRLALGVQGVAPYWIEVDAAAFLSDKGDITARVEAEHDVRVTQRLVLQPRAELDFALQDIPREKVGAGLSNLELGTRLRFEIAPNFAPYVGLAYERAIGDSARFHRAEGEDPGGFSLALGVRAWF